MSSRILPLALVLAVFAGSGFPIQLDYLCTMDGQVRSACCCAPEDGSATDGLDPCKMAGRDCCCDLRISDRQPPGSENPLRSTDPGPFATALIQPEISEHALAPVDRSVARAQTASSLDESPPIYLQICSLLI